MTKKQEIPRPLTRCYTLTPCLQLTEFILVKFDSKTCPALTMEVSIAECRDYRIQKLSSAASRTECVKIDW